jgi:hypothetical protein
MNDDLAVAADLERYMTCQRCGAGFERLYVGGVGDHRQTILCEKCFFIRRNVPYEAVIVPLIAKQYELGVEEAKRRDSTAHQAYIATIAKQANY